MTTVKRVMLLSRPGCHLCEQAGEVITSVAGSLAPGAVEIVEINVDEDRELRAEYGDMVPVVLIDGVQHGYFRIDADRFRRAMLG